jgi:hypothetical protein
MRHCLYFATNRASFHFIFIISTNIWAALPLSKAAEQQNICRYYIKRIALSYRVA